MATVFPTERLNIQQAFQREKYEGYENLLGELVQQNDFLRVAAVLPANKGAVHDTLVADKLGKGSVRAANEGIALMASHTHVKSDPVVSYEGDSVVDDLVISSSPDPFATRMSEDAMNLAGFSNGWNDILITGTAKDQKGFDGLNARRNKASMNFVTNLGGSNDLTSAYLIEFGNTAVSLRYTPGSAPGLHSEDKGQHQIYLNDMTYFWGWVQHYAISFGLSVRQERALQRFCNIDVTSTSIFDSLLQGVIRGKNKLPSKGRSSYLFCNTDLLSMFEIAILNKASNVRTVEIENYGPVSMFVNVPILPMDAIQTGETKVS